MGLWIMSKIVCGNICFCTVLKLKTDIFHFQKRTPSIVLSGLSFMNLKAA